MNQLSQNICTPLPANITSRITTCANSEQCIINFLQNTLPNSDAKSIQNELRKTFIFSKLKRKEKLRKKAKNGGRFLSARKRQSLGLGKVGCESQLKYSDVLPLNEMWLKYVRQAIGGKPFEDLPRDPQAPSWENFNAQLSKADFHGAKISILRSKCPSLVGVEGIVIQETKNVFRICCTDDVIRTIPKDVVELRIHLNDVTLRSFGKLLTIRPAERTVKKFKSTRVFEL